MAIPEEQLRKLDGALWEHEVRMKVISRLIRSMEAEKQAPETAIPEEQVWEHEVRMKVISRLIRSMEAERQAHETLLKLGQSQKVREALGAIYDDPEAARPLVDDPMAFLRSNGIDLGQTDIEVTVGSASDENVLEMRFRQATINYKVAWHRSDGFTLMGV
jgi:hypothetical protein